MLRAGYAGITILKRYLLLDELSIVKTHRYLGYLKTKYFIGRLESRILCYTFLFSKTDWFRKKEFIKKGPTIR
jgi:hypothetical protein